MNKLFALVAAIIGLSIATPALADHYHSRHRQTVTSFSFSVTVGRDRHRPGYHNRRHTMPLHQAQRHSTSPFFVHPAHRHYPSRHYRSGLNSPRGNVTIIRERTTVIFGR